MPAGCNKQIIQSWFPSAVPPDSLGPVQPTSRASWVLMRAGIDVVLHAHLLTFFQHHLGSLPAWHKQDEVVGIANHAHIARLPEQREEWVPVEIQKRKNTWITLSLLNCEL